MEVISPTEDTKSVIKAFIRTESSVSTVSTMENSNNNTTITTSHSIITSSNSIYRIHDQHMRILTSPLFESYGPKIIDSIFTLDKFPLQVELESRAAANNNMNNSSNDFDSQSLIPVLKTATGPLRRNLSQKVSFDNDRGFYLTTFEWVLIFINIVLLCGVGTTLFMYIKLFV